MPYASIPTGGLMDSQEAGSLPHPLALGNPALLLLFAELTTVWGTSENRGGRALVQESQAEGSSVGQPAPGPPHSPPPDFPSPQHHFSSKMVRAEHPLLSLDPMVRGASNGQSGAGPSPRLPTPGHPPGALRCL